VGNGKVERKINVHSDMYAFLALISIILLVIFPIGIDVGAALIYFGVISGSVTIQQHWQEYFLAVQERQLHFLVLLMLKATHY